MLEFFLERELLFSLGKYFKRPIDYAKDSCWESSLVLLFVIKQQGFALLSVFCICLLSFPYHQPLFSTVLTDFCSNIQRGDGGRDNLATGQDEQSQAPSKMCPGGELMLDLNTLFILWWHLLFFVLVKKQDNREFLGGPVVRNPHFHCRGHRFGPWSGN